MQGARQRRSASIISPAATVRPSTWRASLPMRPSTRRASPATAATAAVISDSALADDAEITIDVDQIGDGTAKGLKVYLIGKKA